MTAIVSCVTGGYDRPKVPIPQSVPVDYVMITDDPKLRAPGWQLVPCLERSDNPRLAAKWPKLSPWEHAESGPWIWVDGHIQIESRHFAEQVLSAVDMVGMFRHPDRDCAYDEAEFSSKLPKYADTSLKEQADYLNEMGFPRHWGLWATGVIVYKFELPHLADGWWKQMQVFGFQDQVSLPYALYALQLKPEQLPYSLRDNPWFKICSHRDGTS